MRVFNDECLYNMRHSNSLKNALQDFKYTRAQFKVLVEDLAEDKRVLIADRKMQAVGN